jgi:hypothetical protein
MNTYPFFVNKIPHHLNPHRRFDQHFRIVLPEPLENKKNFIMKKA